MDGHVIGYAFETNSSVTLAPASPIDDLLLLRIWYRSKGVRYMQWLAGRGRAG